MYISVSRHCKHLLVVAYTFLSRMQEFKAPGSVRRAKTILYYTILHYTILYYTRLESPETNSNQTRKHTTIIVNDQTIILINNSKYNKQTKQVNSHVYIHIYIYIYTYIVIIIMIMIIIILLIIA